MALVLAMAMTMAMSGNVFAAEAKDLDDGYFIINGNQVVRAYENYENPETSEYVHWTTNVNARGTIVKSFEYKIRYSVTSSSFTVGSTSVSVSSNAHVEYIW